MGNDKTGWKYISKDGTDLGTHSLGPGNKSTAEAIRSKPFPTLQAFLNSKFNNDHDHEGTKEYHFGLQIATDEATDARIIAAATKGAQGIYDVLGDNCIQNCTRPLVGEGLLPKRFGDMVLPNSTFDEMVDYFAKGNKYQQIIYNNEGEFFYLMQGTLKTPNATPSEGSESQTTHGDFTHGEFD